EGRVGPDATMTDTADVVIVGGGVVGASAAYHLAAAGAGSVLVLERADELGTGATGACAGGFRHQFSSRVNILLSLESVRMILRVDSRGGRVPGVSTPGGPVSASVVVNAAGPWAGPLAATAGVDLPVDPIPRQVVVTGPFPGAPDRKTLVIDADTTFYFHREGPGGLMGLGGQVQRPSLGTRLDDRSYAA